MSNKIPNKLKRNCPKCNSIIKYSNKYNRNNAEKDNRLCKKCATKEISNRPEVKRKKSQALSGKNNPMYGMTGSLNPFYGKTHSKETIDFLKEISDGRYTLNWFIEKYGKHKGTELYKKRKKKLSEIGLKRYENKNHQFKGKSLEEIYGKNKADIIKEKISKHSSGKNNPMYGKPSPIGSGNGWSGWYNNWYFRSLKELSYMINVIERFNLNWESAEQQQYKIKYKNHKKQYRNYFADFIISKKYLVEIKPKNLWNSENVLNKKDAAIKFCNKNNLIYKIRDIKPISNNKIKKLYESNTIKFIDRYEKRYKELF